MYIQTTLFWRKGYVIYGLYGKGYVIYRKGYVIYGKGYVIYGKGYVIGVLMYFVRDSLLPLKILSVSVTYFSPWEKDIRNLGFSGK